MDEATLRRLAEDGLLGQAPAPARGLAPGDLLPLAEWCVRRGEQVGDVSLMVVGDALALAGAPWQEDDQGIRTAYTAELDSLLRRHLGVVLNEDDREARGALSRAFREEIQVLLMRWSEWRGRPGSG